MRKNAFRVLHHLSPTLFFDMDIGTYLEYARNKANKVPIAMRKSYKESVAKKRFSRTRYVARVRYVCLLLHIFYWADELEKL